MHHSFRIDRFQVKALQPTYLDLVLIQYLQSPLNTSFHHR